MTGRPPFRSNLKGKDAVTGILSGLTDLLDRVSELADKGAELRREGGFTTGSGEAARSGRFQVGLNIRTAAGASGEPEFSVEPFGDVRPAGDTTGRAAVAERREPPADVFDEADHVLVVVEMPGIAEGEARFELAGDVLTIEAENAPATKRYAKEVLLPRAFEPGAMTTSSSAGVFEIRFSK